MKKIISIVIVSAFVMLANNAFANPNEKAEEFSDPNVKVVVTYTAPAVTVTPAATTPKVQPAKINDALRLQNKFRRLDNGISFR